MPQKLIYTRHSMDVEWRVPGRILQDGIQPGAGCRADPASLRWDAAPFWGSAVLCPHWQERCWRRSWKAVGCLFPNAAPQDPSPRGLCPGAPSSANTNPTNRGDCVYEVERNQHHILSSQKFIRYKHTGEKKNKTKQKQRARDERETSAWHHFIKPSIFEFTSPRTPEIKFE